MVERKAIVLRPRLDHTVINQVAEKLKGKLFTRMRFIKPKPSEVQLTSMKRYYEEYLIIRGKYSLDHCKKLAYTLEVDKDAQKVFILNETFKPDPSDDPNFGDYKAIKLMGVVSFHHENEARFILDNKGREIGAERMRIILNEEWRREELTESGLEERLSRLQISPEEEVNFLRSRLVKRPTNVGEVIKEILEIDERRIFHCPMYQLRFKSTRTGKEANVRIDGITGTVILIESSNKIISDKTINDIIKTSLENAQPIEEEFVETLRIASSDDANRQIIESKVVAAPLPVSKPSEVEVEEEFLAFPAKVVGDVFYVGDRVTAIVGDLEIPSGTTVDETLVVKGNLIVGEDCEILATLKALGTIVLGANTIIKGNVVSAQTVSVGPNVRIDGKVLIKRPKSRILNPSKVV